MILIPVYNPTKILSKLILDIKKQFVNSNISNIKILIVNDGSHVKYDKIFNEITKLENVHLKKHKINLGKGEAIKTGLKVAKEENLPFVVTVDADGQHLPSDVIKIWKKSSMCNHLILGVRDFDKEVPLRSKIGNLLTKFIFNKLFYIDIKDTQTGLRGIPNNLFNLFLSIANSRYDYETACLTSIPRSNKIVQIKIKTIYEKGNPTSHFNPIIDSLKIYWVLFRNFLSSVISAFFDLVIFSLLIFLGFGSFESVIYSRSSSTLLSYFLHKKFTFKSDINHLKTGSKYFLLVLANMIIVAKLTETLGASLDIKIEIIYALISTVMFFINFLIQKIFIFKKPL